MKKLCLFASLFPIFSYSHTNVNLNTDSNPYQVEYSLQSERNLSPWGHSLLHKTEQVKFLIPYPIVNKPALKKKSAMLDVVLIKQYPELKYGCEVTSLTMVLNYAGVKINKMDLYRDILKDTDPLVRSPKGDIIRWGNPSEGFVGDMRGKQPGYAVFDQPMVQLINKYLPNRAINLTNQSFEKVLQHVSDGYPVVVWTTGDFRMPDRWESWYHGQQLINTPLDLHAVVLVGYDDNNVYVNDPLSGKKQVQINKNQFIESWKALKCRAVSYK